MGHNNVFRNLPPGEFSYKGVAPSGETAISTHGTIWMTSLIVSNTSASDVALTLKNNASTPVTLYNNTLSAGDHRSFTYDEGWEFESGVRWSAGASDSIYVQMLGRQKATP